MMVQNQIKKSVFFQPLATATPKIVGLGLDGR